MPTQKFRLRNGALKELIEAPQDQEFWEEEGSVSSGKTADENEREDHSIDSIEEGVEPFQASSRLMDRDYY